MGGCRDITAVTRLREYKRAAPDLQFQPSPVCSQATAAFRVRAPGSLTNSPSCARRRLRRSAFIDNPLGFIYHRGQFFCKCNMASRNVEIVSAKVTIDVSFVLLQLERVSGNEKKKYIALPIWWRPHATFSVCIVICVMQKLIAQIHHCPSAVGVGGHLHSPSLCRTCAVALGRHCYTEVDCAN